MAEFNFVAPLLPGKTAAWRQAIAEMNGPRRAAWIASRKRHGVKREFVCLQSTPMGDVVVVHMDAPQDAVSAMAASTDEFDVWFRDTVLVGTHGFDPKGPPPSVEVALDFRS